MTEADLHQIHLVLCLSQPVPRRQGQSVAGLIRRGYLHLREASSVQLAPQLAQHRPLRGDVKVAALLGACALDV